MAKGDDALRKKRNKANRKRLHSESSVSARVAAVIAARRRRKAGKRRICEGMCFSLPTQDDPFNERHEKKAMEKSRNSKKQRLNMRDDGRKGSDSALDTDKKLREKDSSTPDTEKTHTKKKTVEKTECNAEDDGYANGGVSKFLMLCLKTIENTWVEEGTLKKGIVGNLLWSSWGAEFCRVCSVGSSIVATSGTSATREQVAWLVSTAADIVARKEKQGIVVPSPFLLFIASSKDRAIEVRSLCKPLKALGVHTVSLHSGTSLDYQVHGLKNCEPEFFVSTPERLLELVSLNAIDISATSLLVIDGMRQFIDLGQLNNLKAIRDRISGGPQVICFSDCHGDVPLTELLQHLIRGTVYRLSSHLSVPSTSAFVSQYIHLYTSEEEKLSKVIPIIDQALGRQTTQSFEVLLICGNETKINSLSSCLKSKGYDVYGDTRKHGLHKPSCENSGTVLVKDFNNLYNLHMDKFEIVIIADFPSIKDYIAILTKIARHTLAGVLHSFFSTADFPLAHSLIEVLQQCGQVVPDFLKSL